MSAWKRLNLGSGDTTISGYLNRDGKHGDVLYPLPDADESVHEIRASHVLEHFAHGEIHKVLADWVRVLEYGGVLKIAVPDFEKIARLYLDGAQIPVEGFIMGGQVDERDFHKSIFDLDALKQMMRNAGLRDIRFWQSEIQDCASYPISLNLQGTKRRPLTREDVKQLNPAAAMSVPRLGFMDNFFCAFSALGKWDLPLMKFTGAFWGQCLERCMETWVKEGREWILTIDYDSIFTHEHISDLLELARDTNADAIAPVQAHRSRNTPLVSILDENGQAMPRAPKTLFIPDLTRVATAHFGCTLIRVAALKEMPKPWFWSTPDPNGGWHEGRTDDDVRFWHQWREHGKSLYLANHVVIGHAELMVRWPGQDFQAIYQHPSEYYEGGPPEDVWQ